MIDRYIAQDAFNFAAYAAGEDSAFNGECFSKSWALKEAKRYAKRAGIRRFGAYTLKDAPALMAHIDAECTAEGIDAYTGMPILAWARWLPS